MWRNKEIKGWFYVNFLIFFTCFLLYRFVPDVDKGLLQGSFPTRGEAVLVFMFLLLTGNTLYYTLGRYRKIRGLYDTLTRIRNGAYHLDVRHSGEGELSILESEIYKLTLVLMEQAELLLRDKTFLAEAISDISHQLKTPLTSMMVMVELLGKGDLPLERRMEFTSNLRRQMERMDWLLSSLLKMSKMDAGTVRFKKEPVIVKSLVKQAMERLLIPMELKEQTLLVEGSEGVTFLGDLEWSVEALTNIGKNCMEHTGKGGEIRISFSENNIYTQIQIEDNGKGIDKEDLPHIFERFYKGRNSAKDSVGIGLALAKQILVSQNGRIDVESVLGEGTRFLIRIYR